MTRTLLDRNGQPFWIVSGSAHRQEVELQVDEPVVYESELPMLIGVGHATTDLVLAAKAVFGPGTLVVREDPNQRVIVDHVFGPTHVINP